jgi:hypothetical protein
MGDWGTAIVFRFRVVIVSTTTLLLLLAPFPPVASGTQRVCKNNTTRLSSPLASGKFSDKHQNPGEEVCASTYTVAGGLQLSKGA